MSKLLTLATGPKNNSNTQVTFMPRATLPMLPTNKLLCPGTRNKNSTTSCRSMSAKTLTRNRRYDVDSYQKDLCLCWGTYITRRYQNVEIYQEGSFPEFLSSDLDDGLFGLPFHAFLGLGFIGFSI